MAGNLESGEQGKRKRGRPRKTAADATGLESVAKPARKRRTRLNSSEEQPAVVVPGTDDDDSGAALENLAAFVDTPEPPMFERRRRYQFVMDENTRHLLGIHANRVNVTTGYIVNELVKKYCRGEIDVPIDRETADGWLDHIDGAEMPQERPI